MIGSLRIRNVVIAGLLLLLAFLWLAYVLVHFVTTGNWSIDSGDGHRAVWFVAPAGFALTLLAAGYGLRRLIVKPIEALGRASAQIAEGDWNIELPDSRIAEIASVRDGFVEMAASLRRSFAEQAELEEERRFMIGAIAHDLRTPLFALRGYLDGLEQGIAATPEQMQRYVAVCKEKAVQLDRLVEDLFAFAKTEYLQMTPRSDTLDCRDLLRKSVEDMRRLADIKGIVIVLDESEQACFVKGDAHLLERAINNLLDNAVRHTPANGRIFTHCRREEDGAVITIRDTGPGFAASELARAFDPLFRGEASRNRATGGAGLGLAIARRIFRAHGGELTASNDSAGGAVLIGRLPAAE